MERSLIVSVIVPVLNGKELIFNCLKAIRAQSYQGKVEIIVVNDGSTDNTSAVAKSFPGIQLIEQENRGRAASRNRGVSVSSGEIIAFTDADCVPLENWLALLVERIIKQGEKCGIVSGSIAMPAKSNLWQKLDHQAWAHSIGPEAPGNKTLFGSTANMCMLRSVFDKVGGFDEKLKGSEDSDLAFRVHKAGHENYFEPKAIVLHDHPRKTFSAFMKQRFNYGKWTIQTVLKHKPLPPYSWLFPNSVLLLILFWPGYAVLAAVFTVLRNWKKDLSVIWLSPLHLLGRLAEYLGTIVGCKEYQRLYKQE